MPSPETFAQRLARQRAALAESPYPDPDAGAISTDDALAAARRSLAGADDFMAGINAQPAVRQASERARGATDALERLRGRLAEIDAPDTPGIAGAPDTRNLAERAFDTFTGPIGAVQRQIERDRALTEAEDVTRGPESPGAAALRGFGEGAREGLMGLVSPASAANVAMPALDPVSRLGRGVASLLRAGDLIGTPVEAGRGIVSAAQGNYGEAAQHFGQAGMMGLGLASHRGAAPEPAAGGRRGYAGPLNGEVLDPTDLVRQQPPAPGQRALDQPPIDADYRVLEDMLALPPHVLEGEVVGDHPQLPGRGPIITPPGEPGPTPAALPPRGPLVTPPPPEPTFLDRIPPAGQQPRGQAPVRTIPPAPDFVPTPAVSAPQEPVTGGIYQPKGVDVLGRRVTHLDLDQGVAHLEGGQTMRVTPDLVDALRAQDPNIPAMPNRPTSPAAPETSPPPTAAPAEAPSEARTLRENRNQAALERYRKQFDPTTMQAIEQFAERNPRVFSTLSLTPDAPNAGAVAGFQPFAEAQGARVGNVKLGAAPGASVEDVLQSLEHEAVHGTQARRFGGEAFDALRKEQGDLPYREQPFEQSAFATEKGRAAQRAKEQELGRPLTGAERSQINASARAEEDPLAWLEQEINKHAATQPREDLARAAYTDPLTGLPNRRGLEALEQRAGGEPLHVVGDLRNFKAVNDILGPTRGDELLRAFSDELRGTLRRGDVPGRIGGDEFALALQGVTPEGRAAVQQKLEAATQRALGRFGATAAGEHPIGARFGFGGTREEALAELNRQKELETGPKYRDVHENRGTGESPEAGEGLAPRPLAKPPAAPVPGVRYELPASAIEADPQRFQYRKGTDTAGVSAERQLEGQYDPAQGGMVAVWKDPENGKTYVVNGHHRLDLAKRAGARVGVVYLDAPDAPSARAAGAVINLREGNSSMSDAVSFMRDSGMPPDRLRDFGISPRSTIGRDAPAIASLADPVRTRWENGEISDDQAAAIGSAKLAPEQQQAVAQLLERQTKAGKEVSGPVLRNVIAQVQRAGSTETTGTGAQGNIFDMLGDQRFESNALHRAELTDWVRGQMSRDRRLFGYVSKGDRAGRLGEAGVANVDTEKAGGLAEQSKRIGGVFDRLEQSQGPISDALNVASQRMLQGENPHVVREQLLDAVRRGVETELRGGGAAPGEVGLRPAVSMGRAEPGPLPEVGAREGGAARRGPEEAQPTLPSAGSVRDVENPTPTFEAPFALQRQKATGLDALEQTLLPPAEAKAPTKVETPAPNGLTPEQQTDRLMTPEARDSRYNANLEELSKVFEAEQPGRIQRAAERRRAARGSSTVTSLPGGGQETVATPARLARSRQMASEIAAEPSAAVEGRKRTPAELRQVQSEQTHRARAIGKAIEARDYEQAAELIGEQAERWNRARLREGTGAEDKEPKRYERNGEYLASDFGALHKFLFTPEGRAQLRELPSDAIKAAQFMARTPALRALIGGVAGFASGSTPEDRVRNAMLGAILAAGTPSGYRALARSFEHYQRTGRVMYKSPDVKNADLSYWRAFGSHTTIERNVPELFSAAEDVRRDLHQRLQSTSDADLRKTYAQGANRLIAKFAMDEAKEAERNGQPRLAARLRAHARDLVGTPTPGQEGLKSALQAMGKKNATGRELEGPVQRLIYRTYLGYALDSASKNNFQFLAALAYVSPRNLYRGARVAHSDAGVQAFSRFERPLTYATEGVEKPGLSGTPMRLTDEWNRRRVFFGSLAEDGQLDHVMNGRDPDPEALARAERIMRLTQGDPHPLARNPFARGPVGGSLKPFTKFPSLMIDYYTDLLQGKTKYPAQAVATMLGLGLAGAGLGVNAWDLVMGGPRLQMPPAAAALARGAQYVSGEKRVVGDMLPRSADPHDVLDSDLSYMLLGRYPTKVAKTALDLSSSQHPLADLESLLGFTNSDVAAQRDETSRARALATDLQQQRKSDSAARNRSYDRAARAGDTAKTSAIESQLSPAQIRALRRRISRGDLERIRQQLPLADRARFDQDFGASLQQEREQPR